MIPTLIAVAALIVAIVAAVLGYVAVMCADGPPSLRGPGHPERN